jgi:hypothetical protein
MKTKKNKLMQYKGTSEFWETTAGKKVQVIRVYWYNGEHHAAIIEDGHKKDIPLCFLEDAK